MVFISCTHQMCAGYAPAGGEELNRESVNSRAEDSQKRNADNKASRLFRHFVSFLA
jgi:hypothetical protein